MGSLDVVRAEVDGNEYPPRAGFQPPEEVVVKDSFAIDSRIIEATRIRNILDRKFISTGNGLLTIGGAVVKDVNRCRCTALLRKTR